MATVIYPDGTNEEASLAVDVDVLARLYYLIGCEAVQQIHLDRGRSMWVDEKSKARSPLPPINDEATQLLHAAGGIPWDVVLGVAVVTEPGEVD